jgi:hypothetical protein
MKTRHFVILGGGILAQFAAFFPRRFVGSSRSAS